MLNLLRFGENGRELYAKYAKALDEAYLPKYGGEVIFAGNGSTALVGDQTQTWDAVLLVRYPSRQAFCDMVADPAYHEFTKFRTDALSEAVLQATVSWVPAEDAG